MSVPWGGIQRFLSYRVNGKPWKNSGQGNKVQIQFILFRTDFVHFCMYVVQYSVPGTLKL